MARGYHSLRDLAKNLFGDIISEEDFNSVYTRDGVFLEDVPFAAQTHVYRVKTQFNKGDDNRFKMTLDLTNPHQIENANDITKEEMNSLIRPAFANAYLYQQGISPTEKALRAVNHMFPITEKNIQVNTKNKGYDLEQIIVKERPDEYFETIKQKAKSNSTEKKCSTILEEFFPRELPIYKARVYTPDPKYISLQMIENGSKIAENCTSTLVKKRKPCTVPNPFSKPFELILTKEKVDQVITTFCDKFDFKKNFKMNSAQIEQIRQVLTLGLVPRLFYHLAKYIHAILVLGIEDLSSYIRIRAIWYMCQAKYPPNDELSVLSPVLVMFKVCSVLIFATEAPKYYITNQKDMEATLFNIIEKMLNPYHLFDSMRDQPKTQHAPKPIRIPTGRSLADIINLVENHQLLEEDGIIARAMLNQNAPMDLLKILSNEPWGDLIQEEIEEEDTRDNMLALPIQRIIQ